jgi:hypothetical protein
MTAMSNFEDHLWQAFVAEHGDGMARISRPAARHAQSGRRLRRPALLTGTGLGIAGLATAGVFALTSASPAFAVTKNPDGTVNVTLSDLSDLPALNQKLAQDGIPVTAVPISTSCSATGAINNPSGEGMPRTQASQDATDVVTIDPSQIPSGDIGVLGASQTVSGQVTLLFGDTAPPAPSCLNSAAFSRSQTGDTSTRGTP